LVRLETKHAGDPPGSSFYTYQSQETFQIYDNLDRPLPRRVDVNERKLEVINDYIGNDGRQSNWRFQAEGGADEQDPLRVTDLMTPPTIFWRHPTTGQPRFPDALPPPQLRGVYGGRKVKHRTVKIFVGHEAPGLGLHVYTATQQYYRDHAQHE
jgi:hypothetical protein